jgi:hypothetical protein
VLGRLSVVNDHIVDYQCKGEFGGIVCFSISTEDYEHILAVFHSGVTLTALDYYE